MPHSPEVAHTRPGGYYPAYVNLRQEGDHYKLTVRGDPQRDHRGVSPGEAAVMTLSRQELEAWLENALAMVRGDT